MMDLDEILLHILVVYRECNIKENDFPIDCVKIVNHFGFSIKPYSALTPKQRAAGINLSYDACTIHNTIYYNDTFIHQRIRFSLIHELGHHILQSHLEDDADCFAGHFLAPRAIMNKLNCKNAEDVHSTFDISYTASNWAWANYRLRYWTSVDHKIYTHFFPKPIIPVEPESVKNVKQDESFNTKPISHNKPSAEFEEHRQKALSQIRRRRNKIQRELKELQEDLSFLSSIDPTFNRAGFEWNT